MLKAVIFDLDGVIVDTMENIKQSFAVTLKKYGVECTEEEYKEFFQMSLKQVAKIWEEKYNLKINLNDFSQEAGAIEMDLLRKSYSKNEDLHLLLSSLKEKGIKLAIGTSSPTWRTLEILNIINAREYFEVIVCADNVERHKPFPDVYLKVLEKLRVEAQSAIVIEDSVAGISSAKNAKIKVVGVITPYVEKEKLEADFIISDFSELSFDKIKTILN